MASSKSHVAVPGVTNKRGAKTPRPKKSSPGFIWPSAFKVTPEQKQAFAVFLLKRMEEMKHTHISLAKHFWGVTAKGGTAGATVRKWLLKEKTPDKKIAAYLADYFKVSMEEMLQARGEWRDPSHVVVGQNGARPTGRVTNAEMAKRAANGESAPAAPIKRKYRKLNGHAQDDHDPRWTLPAGVDPPFVKMETSKTHAQMNLIEVNALVPPEVAMMVYSALNQYKAEPADDM